MHGLSIPVIQLSRNVLTIVSLYSFDDHLFGGELSGGGGGGILEKKDFGAQNVIMNPKIIDDTLCESCLFAFALRLNTKFELIGGLGSPRGKHFWERLTQVIMTLKCKVKPQPHMEK